MESQADRIRDYAIALERATVERESQAAPQPSGAELRRPVRTAVRAGALACLVALLVGVGLLVSDNGDRPVVVAGRSDPLPYLTFLPDLAPGSAPIAAWSTVPYITGIQDYEIPGDGGGPSRRFRYVAFSQKLAADGTPVQTVTLVLSDAAEGDFDRAKLSALLVCSDTVNVQGPDALVGIDPVDGSVVFEWRVQEGVVAVVSVRGYDRASAVELVRHLGYVHATWSKTVEGVPTVRSPSDPDANWRDFERFRTGDAGEAFPPATRPAFRESACS